MRIAVVVALIQKSKRFKRLRRAVVIPVRVVIKAFVVLRAERRERYRARRNGERCRNAAVCYSVVRRFFRLFSVENIELNNGDGTVLSDVYIFRVESSRAAVSVRKRACRKFVHVARNDFTVVHARYVLGFYGDGTRRYLYVLIYVSQFVIACYVLSLFVGNGEFKHVFFFADVGNRFVFGDRNGLTRDKIERARHGITFVETLDVVINPTVGVCLDGHFARRYGKRAVLISYVVIVRNVLFGRVFDNHVHDVDNRPDVFYQNGIVIEHARALPADKRAQNNIEPPVDKLFAVVNLGICRGLDDNRSGLYFKRAFAVLGVQYFVIARKRADHVESKFVRLGQNRIVRAAFDLRNLGERFDFKTVPEFRKQARNGKFLVGMNSAVIKPLARFGRDVNFSRRYL